MLTTRNPETIAQPGGLYSHSVEVPPNARWLFIAGQVGIRPDGTMPDSLEEQDEQMWKNKENVETQTNKLNVALKQIVAECG